MPAIPGRPVQGKSERSPQGPPAVAREDDDAARAVRRYYPAYWAVLAVLALVGLQLAVFIVRDKRLGWPIVWHYMFDVRILDGLQTTIEVTAICMVSGSIVGLITALARLSKFKILRGIAFGYVWLFRSVPILVQLLIWFNLAYLLPTLSIGIPFGPHFGNWNTNNVFQPFVAALITLTFSEGARTGEIIRGGLLSVDRGQKDAARALGLSARTTHFRIVIPQAARVIIPPMGTQFITLLQTTSLLSVITLYDLLGTAENIYGLTLQILPLLLVASIWYTVLVAVLSVIQSWLERRLSLGYATPSTTRPATVRNALRASTWL